MSWELSASLALGFVLLAGFRWYEASRPPARVLALVAALAALAVVGRLAFAAVPNVKPTTDVVLFAGYALGAIPGFAVGAISALASNIFFGQGPWTVWQMAAWGAVGGGGALLAWAVGRRELGRVPLALACGVAGLAFGAFMDLYQWTLAAQQNLDTYIAVAGTSLPYNLAHAIGNVVFCLLIGPAFVRALARYRRRFEVTWPAPAPAAVAGVVVLLVAVASGATTTPTATAATPASEAAAYLTERQNRDGGFGGGAGQSSSPLYTGWATLGLAAAGRNARDIRRGRGRTVARYLRGGIPRLRDIGEIERSVLVLRSAGLSPRRFAGRDLVAEILRRRRGDGSWAGFVSYTSFGLLALRAAREPIPPESIRWLTRSRQEDGGFGLTRAAPADADMTGAALQALRAAGRSGPAVDGAVRWLVREQNRDGGWGISSGRDSNSQSTSYAIQGLVAAGAAPGVVARARRYIVRLQRRDGHVSYSRSSDQTPVWVTAQAIMALRRKPLPLAPVPRRPAVRQSAVGVPDGDASAAGAAGGIGGGDRRDGDTEAPAEKRAPGMSGPAPATQDPDPGSLDVRPADSAPAGETDEGVPPLVLAGAVALVLLVVFLGRRRLHRRRPTLPSG